MSDDPKLDAFYKEHYGFDPAKLPDNVRANADRALEAMRPTRGNPVFGANDPIMQARANFDATGLTPKLARDLAIYDAWKSKQLPPDVDALSDDLIAKHKIAGPKADEYKAKRDAALKGWLDDTAGAYNHLIPPPPDAARSDKEERAIVMEPETITSDKAKKAPPEAPAAPKEAAKGKEGQEPPPSIAAPPEGVPPALAPSEPGPRKFEKVGHTIRQAGTS